MATAVGTPSTLVAKADSYGGMIVDSNLLPSHADEFSARLAHSMKVWQEDGKRGIWLKIPTKHAHLVGAAVNGAGFQFHHAQPDYLMLTHWLPDTPSTLPAGPSHQVGVGAFVLNERKEVLVVQEKNGPLKGKQVWKLPTGLIDRGEDVSAAAEREVLEETGVVACFRAVLSIRQAHGMVFGNSDLFFVCALHPLPGQEDLQAQEEEIADVRWMPLREYTQTALVRDLPLYKKVMDRCVAYAEGEYGGLRGVRMQSGVFSNREDLLLWGGGGDDDLPASSDIVSPLFRADSAATAAETPSFEVRTRPVDEKHTAASAEPPVPLVGDPPGVQKGDGVWLHVASGEK